MKTLLTDRVYSNCTFSCVLGIDSAAMFQECLLVLRSIVLSALGINIDNSQQSPDMAMHNKEQLNFAMVGDPDSPQTQSDSTTAKQRRNLSSSTIHLTKVIPRDKQSDQIFVTPSPHSGLSSGFGSMHDEEESIYYEPSYGRKEQHVSQNQCQHSQKDSHLTEADQRFQEREQKRHRLQKHRRHQSQNTPSSNRDHTHMHVINKSDSQVQDRRSHCPPPTVGGWVTPENSITVHQRTMSKHRDANLAEKGGSSSDNQPANPSFMGQTLNSTSCARGLESDYHEENAKYPPLIKSLSPRAYTERKKLQSKQIELLRSKEEKQRLVTELNLLNLKVQEEGTK